MSFDTSFLESLFDSHILPHSADCDRFKDNIKLVADKMISSLDHQARTSNNDEIDRVKHHINLYKSAQSNPLKKFNIANNAEMVIDQLETAAVEYLITVLAKNFGLKSINKISELKRVETLSKELSNVFASIDNHAGLTLVSALTLDDGIKLYRTLMSSSPDDLEISLDESTRKVNELMETTLLIRFQTFKKELEFFSSIREHLQKTLLGKWLQVGVPGPKQNSALDSWIISLAYCWSETIGRSLSVSVDGLGGREQFLQFAEYCMFPLHPSLGEETDTIRNAYEKLRKRNALDYSTTKSNLLA